MIVTFKHVQATTDEDFPAPPYRRGAAGATQIAANRPIGDMNWERL